MNVARSCCSLGVAPEDVAAWLLDGQPLPDGVSEAHVASCAACRETVSSMGSTRPFIEQLREPIQAPASTVVRVMQRVRLEMLAGAVIATVVDGVADVFGDLLGPDRREGH